MTETELIQKVRAGGRLTKAESEHVLHDAANPQCNQHYWRTVACDNQHDVIECSRCGDQRVSRCNFDEDMS